jgi:hypothetical protein
MADSNKVTNGLAVEDVYKKTRQAGTHQRGQSSIEPDSANAHRFIKAYKAMGE